jgi:hypothetical protein
MIPPSVIQELKNVGHHQPIENPNEIFEIASLSKENARLVGASSLKVFISKRSLKHVIDQRGDGILSLLPEIIASPTKISNNSKKRLGSFIFARMLDKANGAVVEITEKPDGNRVVSAFPISKYYYRKLTDISGRTAVPPFSTPSN